MNKLLSLGLIAAALALAAGENLIQNASFEEGRPRGGARILPGWSVRGADRSYELHRIDPKGGIKRSRAAAIRVGKAGRTGYFSPEAIALKPAARYRLSYQVKFISGSVKTTCRARISVLDSGKKFRGMGSLSYVDAVPGGVWHEVSGEITTPAADAGGYFAAIQLGLSGPGEAWFDEVKFEELPVPRTTVEFYPSTANSEKKLYAVRGETLPCLFHVFTSESPQNMSLEVTASSGLVLAAAVPVMAQNAVAEPFTSKTIAGGTMYSVALAPQVVLPSRDYAKDLARGTGLLFRTAPDLKNGKISWRLFSGVKLLKNGVFDVVALPSYSGRLPENFCIYTWYAPFLNALHGENLTSRLDSLMKSGVRGGSINGADHAELFNQKKFRNLRCFWFRGKCPTRMAEDRLCEKFAVNWIGRLKKYHRPVLNWNYEPGLPEYYHHCPRCRAAFEKQSGKSAAALASGEAVEKKYPREYRAFRNAQQLKIVRDFATVCRKNNALSSICSYTHPGASGLENFERRLGDIRQWRGVLDYYMPQIYFAPETLWNKQRDMLEYYPGALPCYTSDERHGGKSYQYSLLTPEALRIELLAAAVQGAQAVTMFVGAHTFDGRQMLEMRRTLERIARYEKIFASGRVETVKVSHASDDMRARLLLAPDGKTRLLALLNTGSFENGRITIEPSAQWRGVAAFDDEKSLRYSGVPERFEWRLPPLSATFLRIGGPEGSGAAYGAGRWTLPEKRTVRRINLPARGEFTLSGEGRDAGDLDRVRIGSRGKSVTLELADGATVNAGKEPGVLFRDLFREPADARWSPDNKMKYRLNAVALEKEGLAVTVSHHLRHPSLSGMSLVKKLIFTPGLDRIAAEITLTWRGREKRSFAYWAHHQPGVRRAEACCEAAGEMSFRLSDVHGENHFLRPVGTQFLKLAGRYWFGLDRAYLDQFYIWNGSEHPTLEIFVKPEVLAPGASMRLRLHWSRFTSKPATASPKRFTLDNPYAAKGGTALRASLHTHARFRPEYQHAPVPPAERIRQYRDAKVTPRYGFVTISEHNRITLPENTIPRGVEPQWGVENVVFVPGIERCIGTSRGALCGDLKGEINCVGVSRKKVVGEQTHGSLKFGNVGLYLHNRHSPKFAERTLGELVNDGVFVALCHPNAKLDGDGIQRWPSSGWTWDELDLIFGAPEKGIKGFKTLPDALEIGNQGYDFTDRSNFTNAEAKYDALLSRGFRLWGTASDDAHHQAPLAGWVVVFVDRETPEALVRALKTGCFYASQGPRITCIDVVNNTLKVATDQPSEIEFIGRNGRILARFARVRKAAYTVRGDEMYVRTRVTRECPEARTVGGGVGKRRSAWTNPIFIRPAE